MFLGIAHGNHHKNFAKSCEGSLSRQFAHRINEHHRHGEVREKWGPSDREGKLLHFTRKVISKLRMKNF